MPNFKRKLTYQEIQTAIAYWMREQAYPPVEHTKVHVIVDHGGGTVMDPGFIMARADAGEIEAELNEFEIKQAIELWLLREKNLVVTSIHGITIGEDRGGGTPLDSGGGISGEAPVRNK